MDQGAMTVKEYSEFSNLQLCWYPTIRLLCVLSRTLVWWKSYPSAEKQSVYSRAPADREMIKMSSLQKSNYYNLKKLFVLRLIKMRENQTKFSWLIQKSVIQFLLLENGDAYVNENLFPNGLSLFSTINLSQKKTVHRVETLYFSGNKKSSRVMIQ